jgi:hypothetical protein
MIEWTPFPGHWPGQEKEGIFYASTAYRQHHAEVFEAGPEQWVWSVYGPTADIYDLALVRDTELTQDAAMRAAFDYIEGL